MAETTKTLNGGASYGTATLGHCPRVASTATTDYEDSPYASVEVAITSAQILTMRATPVALVPAPGAGKVLQFLGATVIYDYATAYTESAANLVIENNTGTDMSEILEATGFMDATADAMRHMVPAILGPVMLANEGLYLKNNGAGEYGSGTSVLRVKVLYAVHTTGL
jgi:hypothetical protein